MLHYGTAKIVVGWQYGSRNDGTPGPQEFLCKKEDN